MIVTMKKFHFNLRMSFHTGSQFVNEIIRAGQQSVYAIDPDLTECNELVKVLTNESWQVKAFKNVESFLVQETLTGKACVIIASHIPESSILELLQKLNQQRVKSALIALGNHNELPLAVRLMRAGAAYFLARPVSNHKLLATVKDVFRDF